jgi:cyanate permease
VLVHGVGPIPYGKVISHWFDKRRGLALGLALLGIGCGAVVMPSFAQQLITRFGWHAAFAILGAAALFISVPTVATFLKERPQDLGLLPDGARSENFRASVGSPLPGMSVHDAAHTRTFCLMLFAFVLVGASVQGCLVHMAAMLNDRGMTVQTAALGSSLLGSAVLIGRVGTGYLLDRFFAPHIAALLFGGAALGIGVLWIQAPATLAFAGAFLVGLGLGAEVDIIPYLIGRYFGLRSFGKLSSLAFGAFLLAGALGPLAMGAGFDLTGSYRVPLAALFIATLMATALITCLGPYRYSGCGSDQNGPVLTLSAEAV